MARVISSRNTSWRAVLEKRAIQEVMVNIPSVLQAPPSGGLVDASDQCSATIRIAGRQASLIDARQIRFRTTEEELFREGLINSRFHSAIWSWDGHQGEFGGHPLVRARHRRGSPVVRRPTAALQTHVPYVPTKRRRRARYRFVKPQVTKSQFVFFASPR